MATFSTLGTNNSTTSSATLTVTGAAVDANVGDYLVVFVGCDNNGSGGANSLTSVTDSAGNTYTPCPSSALILRDPGAAAAGITLGIFVCAVTAALVDGTVTANFSPNTAAKAMAVYRAQPDANKRIALRSAGAGATGGSTAIAAPTVSVTNGDTIFGGMTVESLSFPALDTDTTNGNWVGATQTSANTGTAATSAALTTQYKTVNATGNQTYNATFGATVDWAAGYIILGEDLLSPPPVQNPITPFQHLLVR